MSISINGIGRPGDGHSARPIGGQTSQIDANWQHFDKVQLVNFGKYGWFTTAL
jgi:hypothetical protein